MPFGLKMKQDVFQMQMDQITDRIPGIITIHDDICVHGKDTTEHDRNLLQLMQAATQQGLVFNSSKCATCQSQISFYDAIFTVQGMKPEPANIQVLQDLPVPEYSKQLLSFVGLINYLQPFLPDLASKTTFPREQVTNWDWNPSTDQDTTPLKSCICNMLLGTTLPYYNCTQPLVLQTDANEYGLSTELLQNNQPIAFTSKMLILRPDMPIYRVPVCLFGLEKFHTYVN